MASDLSRVTDFPNFNDISVTSREACSEQATSVIDEVTRIVPSLSPEHPIPCRLPPELLAAIFLDYMQQYDHLLTYTMSTVPPWVNVSYVCRYWRSVALNCANLWTQFFFVSSKWMDELLRRSKTAPLIIYLDLYCLKPTPWQICCLEKALGHMERIQDLWINCGCFKDVLSMIHARLTAAAPLLRSLHLATYEDEEDRDGEDHFIICKDMLPGVSLRKLHLELCDVNWSSPDSRIQRAYGTQFVFRPKRRQGVLGWSSTPPQSIASPSSALFEVHTSTGVHSLRKLVYQHREYYQGLNLSTREAHSN